MNNRKFELSGVYIITNKVNGKFYVGSGKSIFSRWYNHTRQLKNETHINYKLQRAFNKYGSENFKFEILELHPVEGLDSCEQKYLDLLCKAQEYISGESSFFNQNTYNIKPLVSSTRGLEGKLESTIKGVRTRGFDKILKVALDGGVIAEYDMQCDAAEANKINRNTVSKSVKHKRCPKDKDYYFVYKGDYDKDFKPEKYIVHNKGQKGVTKVPSLYKEVFCYDIYNRFFMKFESNTAVAEYFNVDTSSTSRMLDKPKKKVLHRHGIHLYNIFSEEQNFENLILDKFKGYLDDGVIGVYNLFHEYMGSFSKETISKILDCHVHSVSQSVLQQKILKGFYFIKE
jgi:group I intron endonuclease